MTLNLKPVNILPTPTWRWLKLNDTSIELENIGNYQAVVPKIEKGSEKGLKIQDCKIADFPEMQTGMGKVAKEFAESHAAGVKSIRVAAGTKIAEPVILHYNMPENVFCVDDNYIYAEADSKLKVIMVYSSAYKNQGFHGSSLKIFTEENAVVEVIQLQVLGSKFYNFSDVGAVVGSKGKIIIKQLDLGAEKNWLGINVTSAAKEGNVELLNLYLAGKKQQVDINYLVQILGEKTEVQIDSKGILLNNAQKTFRGTLDFQRGCKGSVGSEAEDVVLMDENVVNKSIPIILCNEDDVQGDHAASIGEMDEEQRFYLESRGLDEAQIRRMVIDSKISLMENELPESLHYLLDEYKEVAYCND